MGTLWAKVSNHLQRALYLLGLASFVLPFVTVKGCQSEKITEYAGYELLGEDGGWLYMIPIGLGLLFLALSFLRQHQDVIVRGFISAIKAVLSVAAGYVVAFFPHLQFFGGTVYAATGQYLASTSWALVYASSLGSTLHSVQRTWPHRRRAGVTRTRGLIRPGFWFLATLTVGVFGVSVALSSAVDEWIERYFVLIVAAFTLPLSLALHFAELGLNAQARWAAVSVVLTLLLVLASGVSFLLAPEPFLMYIVPVTASASGLAGLAVGYLVKAENGQARPTNRDGPRSSGAFGE